MKEKILFVTKGGENCDEGFSYALELASTLNTDLTTLVIYPTQMATTFEDVMVTAAFAEAGDLNSVKDLMEQQLKGIRDEVGKKLQSIEEKCRQRQIGFLAEEAFGDVGDAIKQHLKTRPNVDMVLLSPSLSDRRKTVDMKKLLKQVAKPIVAISRPASAEA